MEETWEETWEEIWEEIWEGIQGDMKTMEIQGGVLRKRIGGTQYEEGFMSQSMRVHPAKLNDAK